WNPNRARSEVPLLSLVRARWHRSLNEPIELSPNVLTQIGSSNLPSEEYMPRATAPAAYKSPLHEMTQVSPTCLWNDSASIQELSYSIEHGAVGATCNPVIVVGVLKKEMASWKDRIRALIDAAPPATEGQISWQLVREVS